MNTYITPKSYDIARVYLLADDDGEEFVDVYVVEEADGTFSLCTTEDNALKTTVHKDEEAIAWVLDTYRHNPNLLNIEWDI